MINLHDFGFEISGTPSIEPLVFKQTTLIDFGVTFISPNLTTLQDFEVR